MNRAPQKHAVIVDRDPAVLARLEAELSLSGYATEAIGSTLGLTPDLLELSGPNLLVIDAELPGLEKAALMVIARSLKARRQTRIIVITEQEPQLLKQLAADQFISRSLLMAKGIKALGLDGKIERPLDVRAILDEVLGRQTVGVNQTLNVRVDLFSKSNFFVMAMHAQISGVFVATSVLLPVGQPVQMVVDLLGRSRLECSGSVLWQRPHSSFGGRVATGIGVKFFELNEEQQKAIARFVDLREPLVWGG